MQNNRAKISIGIDCGSAACKGALLIDDHIVEKMIRPTGWSPKETSREVLQSLLTSGGLNRDEVYVVATGYGRLSIDFADRIVTEITCHALGAQYILPGVRTVSYTHLDVYKRQFLSLCFYFIGETDHWPVATIRELSI